MCTPNLVPEFSANLQTFLVRYIRRKGFPEDKKLEKHYISGLNFIIPLERKLNVLKVVGVHIMPKSSSYLCHYFYWMEDLYSIDSVDST